MEDGLKSSNDDNDDLEFQTSEMQHTIDRLNNTINSYKTMEKKSCECMVQQKDMEIESLKRNSSVSQSQIIEAYDKMQAAKR